MKGHAEQCVERFCGLGKKAVSQLQQAGRRAFDDHQMKNNDFEVVGVLFAHRSYWDAYGWPALVGLTFCGHLSHLQEKSHSGTEWHDLMRVVNSGAPPSDKIPVRTHNVLFFSS